MKKLNGIKEKNIKKICLLVKNVVNIIHSLLNTLVLKILIYV